MKLIGPSRYHVAGVVHANGGAPGVPPRPPVVHLLRAGPRVHRLPGTLMTPPPFVSRHRLGALAGASTYVTES
jgi:hypothetical protein